MNARRTPRRLRPFTVSDSSLRPGRKASRNSVQNDGCLWMLASRVRLRGREDFIDPAPQA